MTSNATPTPLLTAVMIDTGPHYDQAAARASRADDARPGELSKELALLGGRGRRIYSLRDLEEPLR